MRGLKETLRFVVEVRQLEALLQTTFDSQFIQWLS